MLIWDVEFSFLVLDVDIVEGTA